MRTGVAALALVVGLTGSIASADICGEGAKVEFPLSEVLQDEALGYLAKAFEMIDWTKADPQDMVVAEVEFAQVVAERSAALPRALADLPYLLVVNHEATFPGALYVLTFGTESTVLPEVVLALERQGLGPEAALARVPLMQFPDWAAGPGSRLQVLIDGGEAWQSDPREMAIAAAEQALHAASPKLQDHVQRMIASDPKIAAEYEALRQAAGPDRRVDHLIWEVMSACMASWWTPEEADAAFAGMAEAQRDVLLMHFFLAESFNGSTHQYFYNSSGTLAPQLAETLDRVGLPEHAAAIRKGMAMFPAPYPRDTDARRAVMARFSTAEDDALYELTAWADDGMILDAMAQVATKAGILPR
jgi:hypothetical protein